jgi:hypothetical protein
MGKDPEKPPFVQEIPVPARPVHAGILPVGGCPVRNVGSVRRSVLAPGLAARDPVVDTRVLVSRVAGPNAPSEIEVVAAPPQTHSTTPIARNRIQSVLTTQQTSLPSAIVHGVVQCRQ